MRELSQTQAIEMTDPGLYRCAKTLYLRVKPSSVEGKVSKSWVQRIVIDGRLTDLGLGSFDLVSMIDAEERAIANRKLVGSGINPLREKRKASVPTFADAMKKTHAKLKHQWENPNTAKQWMQIMEKHAIPKLGRMPVDRITQQDVINVVEPVLLKSHETGGRLRRFVRHVMEWCEGSGFVSKNVAGSGVDRVLPKVSNRRENYRALPWNEIQVAVRTIEDTTESSSKLCILFIIHTGVRGQEARMATWTEIDMEGRVWNIPAQHMKKRKAHRVPLSTGAMEILERARSLSKDKGHIFPSPGRDGQELTSQALLKVLKKTGLHGKTVVHGFRSTMKTWAMDETNESHEVIEMCLAHDVGNTVARAYTRTDLLEKRRSLMQGYSDYLNKGE